MTAWRSMKAWHIMIKHDGVAQHENMSIRLGCRMHPRSGQNTGPPRTLAGNLGYAGRRGSSAMSAVMLPVGCHTYTRSTSICISIRLGCRMHPRSGRNTGPRRTLAGNLGYAGRRGSSAMSAVMLPVGCHTYTRSTSICSSIRLGCRMHPRSGRNTGPPRTLAGNLAPGLRFTQGLTTFTNFYGIFTPPLRLFTALYAPLQITFCKTTTQISDYIDLVLSLSRSRSGY